MSTILTQVTQEKPAAPIIENKKYSSLQLSTGSSIKYVSSTNTIESKSEMISRSRAAEILPNNSIYHVFLKYVLYTVHFIYITYIAYQSLYAYLYTLYISMRYSDRRHIQERIQHDKSHLTKIPKHLAINVSRELLSTRTCQEWENTMFNISMATCWAWEFGIEEVSVYDASGNLLYIM
jgi:hypothetical protein